jgi:hypothetical protein
MCVCEFGNYGCKGIVKVGVKGTYTVVVSQQIMWIFGRECWFCWILYKYRLPLPRDSHRCRFQGSVRRAEFARDGGEPHRVWSSGEKNLAEHFS